MAVEHSTNSDTPDGQAVAVLSETEQIKVSEKAKGPMKIAICSFVRSSLFSKLKFPQGGEQENNSRKYCYMCCNQMGGKNTKRSGAQFPGHHNRGLVSTAISQCRHNSAQTLTSKFSCLGYSISCGNIIFLAVRIKHTEFNPESRDS